jgi:hypothetical protein
MKLLLTQGYKEITTELKTLFNQNGITIYGDADVQSVSLSNGSQLFTIGNVVGVRGSGDSMRKISKKDFSELFVAGVSDDAIRKLEGRFMMMLYKQDDAVIQVFSDRYGQFDCYYFVDGDKAVFASDLSLFPESPSRNGYDQVGLAHALAVYGYRPAKKHTIYKDIKRLGVGETAIVGSDKQEIVSSQFQPIAIEDYGEAEHERYADLFLDALKIRGSDQGNVVYLSSGWDSTSILGGLVHVFGAKKIKAVIGRQRFSARTGFMNPFEIERAQKVADYYEVPLEIVEFDFTKEVPHVLSHLKETMKSNFIASATIITHGILADYIAKNYNNGESIFCGEISDGVHNLGFSQYATIFHPVLDFREYSDKMGSYLYGPTFMDSFVKGPYSEDVIYNLLKSQAAGTVFDEQSVGNDVEKRKQLLSSFFLRNQRLPLVSMKNMKQLTEEGQYQYTKEMEAMYLQDAAEVITPETVYSWYLHLYNSFHWQGATVGSVPITAQSYEFDIQLPFYDSRLQEFLSAMPEHWGRGLDFNPTKFPLKRMLQKRIDYPLHLQVGPHSYLYDVDHSFNHSVEVANYSAFTPVFRELLATHPYHEILSPEIFNLDYMDSIVDRYVNGEEISGAELNILFPLCFFALSGWF